MLSVFRSLLQKREEGLSFIGQYAIDITKGEFLCPGCNGASDCQLAFHLIT